VELFSSLILSAADTAAAASDAANVLEAPNLSIKHLVLNADPVVKFVMLLLVGFSVWCWKLMFEKGKEILAAIKAVTRLEDALGKLNVDQMLRYGDEENHPLQEIVRAGNAEWKDGSGDHTHEALHEVRDRVERAMRLQLSSEMRRLQKDTPFLATVGSAGPFIGLFGTVWGIMNSFISIGASHDTSLAVVAPGIAEALIATGIGLAAAIPAVMAYNKIATELGRYNGRLQTAIGTYAGRLAKRMPAKA